MNEFVHNMNLYSKQVPPYPLQNQLTTQIRKSALEKGYTSGPIFGVDKVLD